MKTEIKKTQKKFTPVELVITMETQEEYDYMSAFFHKIDPIKMSEIAGKDIGVHVPHVISDCFDDNINS